MPAHAARAAQTDASDYPARPVRIIVAGSAGSATDFTARALGQRFAEAWGQPMVIDNRSGAGGIIAHELGARATPDGYTLMFSTSAGLVVNPLLQKTPYDSFRDFAPISLASINPQMLFSHPSVPATNVLELIKHAKARPGALNCASGGTGSPNHLGCELLRDAAKIEFVHVPYKGAAQGIAAVAAGQMHFMFNSIPPVLPLVRAGKLRGLGVSSAKRSAAAPEVPAIAESIPGFDYVNWYAMLAPSGTPTVVLTRIHAQMAKIIVDPPFAQRLTNLGSEPRSSSPAELTEFMRRESARWSRIIKAAGISVEP